MATGQTLLNLMELLSAELQLQSGESDVTKALIALNAAQDYFEARAALHPLIFGGRTTTVTTTAGVETTSYPAGLLRIDRVQYIDPATNRPAWDLHPLQDAGEHAYHSFWPWHIASVSTNGKPRAYWDDGTNIYWDPLPDGEHTIRVYGFLAASDITAGGTFAYPDPVMLPLASFAAKLFRLGLDDNTGELDALAGSTFDPVIQALAHHRRDRARGLHYRYRHDT